MKHCYEYIVSACLCGKKCRYDGKTMEVDGIKKLVDEGKAIVVCPEVMGGLSTPRLPCEIIGNKVLNTNGEDKTSEFLNGAEKTLLTAVEHGIKKAILKEKSPSCGSNFVYDGSFNRTLIPGAGITSKLLVENGIQVISDEEWGRV
jgi:uncharacterized protein YbbK (DUF523 family)